MSQFPLETTEQLALLDKKVEKAEQARDVQRLKQLHEALTTHRGISHYAQMPLDDVLRAVEITEAALARLVPSPKARKKPRKPRKPRVPRPVEFDPTEFEQSDLFADASLWPRRPYCSDDLEAGVKIRSLRQALLHPYVQANPPHLRVWMLFDIDRPDAATAWETAKLLPPTWNVINRENLHGHSAWGVSAPVLVDGLGARDAPMRYLCAIEAMMRDRLDADPGFAGLITKNPAHPRWQTLRGPRLSYSLKELAEVLPGIEKYRPKKRAECVGLGRNVTLFDTLRKDCYSAIRQYWGGGLQGWNAWLSHCNTRALTMNADLFGANYLHGKEVWHIARSVAKWTWRNFSADGFSQWQAQAGKKGGVASGKARAAASEDKRASARLMRSSGMSYGAIAAELGVSKGIVHKWCQD